MDRSQLESDVTDGNRTTVLSSSQAQLRRVNYSQQRTDRDLSSRMIDEKRQENFGSTPNFNDQRSMKLVERQLNKDQDRLLLVHSTLSH